jgi:hypothetical protein
MMRDEIADAIDELAAHIARLKPIGRDGSAADFYEQRSEVAHKARRIAEWKRSGRKPVEEEACGSRNPPHAALWPAGAGCRAWPGRAGR